MKKFELVIMVSNPYPIQSNANAIKKSNPIFITQQNLHAIQMAFLNENSHLDWNPTHLCWALIGSVQSMDFFIFTPHRTFNIIYLSIKFNYKKCHENFGFDPISLCWISSNHWNYIVKISKHQDILRNSYVTTNRQFRQ